MGSQGLGDGSICVRAYGARHEEWQQTCAYDIHTAAEVKKAIAQEYADWATPLVKFSQVAKERDIASRSLYMLPVGHRWGHHPKVTLIGDAAHLMPPYAGEGVNVAMEDAMKLAQAIIRSAKADDTTTSLDTNVKAFEEEMFARAAPVQDRSNTNMELMFFTPGAPFNTIHQRARNALGTGWLIRTFLPLWFVLRLCFRL